MVRTHRFSSGLLLEARALQDEILVVNGMDGSEVNESLIRNLKKGGVQVNLTGGLRLGQRPLVSLNSPHLLFVKEFGKDFVHATSVTDIEKASRDGKPALVFTWQQVDYIGQDADRLFAHYSMGLRNCGLVYNVGNYAGSGCVDPHQGPLSNFGLEVVERIEDLGMTLDVGGHTSEATSLDAIHHVSGPVVCTHANPRKLRDNPRNITDHLIKAIADKGGVIGICAFNYFLVSKGRASIDTYLDHIEYVAELVGSDHVGLGLDFILGREISGSADPRRFPPESYPQRYEEWMIYPEYLTDFTGVPNIIAGLLERDYLPDDIEKIMGGNWLRVWREVWGK